MCFEIYINKCNMKQLNNGFNKFKMNDSTQVPILIVQKKWKNLVNHSNIMIEHWITCVSIYSNKCKMQFMSNDFNILNVNGLTHVHILIIEKMWNKTSWLEHF